MRILGIPDAEAAGMSEAITETIYTPSSSGITITQIFYREKVSQTISIEIKAFDTILKAMDKARLAAIDQKLIAGEPPKEQP